MKDRYTFGFEIWSVIIFLLVMIPNFIWFAFPAKNDILRGTSITSQVNMIASIFQVIMIGSLCLIKNKKANSMCISKWMIASALCCLTYYISWIFYYQGITNAIIILGLVIPPCLTFLFYATDRKNYVAIFPTIIFLVCHLIYGVTNYII